MTGTNNERIMLEVQQKLMVILTCDGTERYSICNRRCSSVDSCAGVMPPGTVGWVDVDDNDDINTKKAFGGIVAEVMPRFVNWKW